MISSCLPTGVPFAFAHTDTDKMFESMLRNEVSNTYKPHKHPQTRTQAKTYLLTQALRDAVTTLTHIKTHTHRQALVDVVNTRGDDMRFALRVKVQA